MLNTLWLNNIMDMPFTERYNITITKKTCFICSKFEEKNVENHEQNFTGRQRMISGHFVRDWFNDTTVICSTFVQEKDETCK